MFPQIGKKRTRGPRKGQTSLSPGSGLPGTVLGNRGGTEPRLGPWTPSCHDAPRTRNRVRTHPVTSTLGFLDHKAGQGPRAPNSGNMNLAAGKSSMKHLPALGPLSQPAWPLGHEDSQPHRHVWLPGTSGPPQPLGREAASGTSNTAGQGGQRVSGMVASQWAWAVYLGLRPPSPDVWPC